MGFFNWLLGSSKKIARTEIVEHIDGISEDDKMTNMAVGHMMGGFDGMVHADLLNSYESAKTVFRVYYTDGTSQLVETEDGSSAYRKYASYLNSGFVETTTKKLPEIKQANTLSEAPEMIDSITEQVDQFNDELRNYLKNYTCLKCGKTMDICTCDHNKTD